MSMTGVTWSMPFDEGPIIEIDGFRIFVENGIPDGEIHMRAGHNVASMGTVDRLVLAYQSRQRVVLRIEALMGAPPDPKPAPEPPKRVLDL